MSQPGPPLSPARQALLLGVVGIGLWGSLGWPAYHLAGTDGLLGLTVSALLCLIPGLAVLLVLGKFAATQPMAPIAASGVRLFCVGVGCVVVRALRPEWTFMSFYLWVGLFYFPLLVLETFFQVKSLPQGKPAADQSSSDNESVSA